METISFKDFPGFLRDKMPKKTLDAARRGLRQGVELHAPRLLQEEIDKTKPPPVDRGTYRRSWHTLPQDSGTKMVIYNTSAQAAIIEYGRRAGANMPPLHEIEGWVRRKGIVPGKGRAVKDARRNAAFAIARSIARRGQRPMFILRRAMKRLAPLVKSEIAYAIARWGK